MENKFLKNLWLFVFGSFVFFCCLNSVQAATTYKSSYYGYLSKSVVQEALSKHTEIPAMKQAALINKLSLDGYFWLDTSRQKLKYIHKNLPANRYLLIVADAENVHSWTVNDKNVSETTYMTSVELQQKLIDESNKGLEDWKRFYDYTEQYQLASGKGCSQLSYFWEIGTLLCKDFWSNYNLDQLYGVYWTDKKQNRNKPQFDHLEVERLVQIARVMGTKPEKPLIRVSITGGEPWEDVMWFIPAEKLVFWGGKVIFKAVAGVGSRVIKSGVFKVGAKVVGDRLVAMAGIRIIRVLAPRIITITRPIIGTLTIDVSKMFKVSALADFEVDAVVKNCVQGLEDLSNHPILGKFISKSKIADILGKTQVESPYYFMYWGRETRVGFFESDWWGKYVPHIMTIRLNEDAMIRGGSAAAYQVYIHEVIHRFSANLAHGGVNLQKSSAYGRLFHSKTIIPLEEGFTQFLTEYFTRTTRGSVVHQAYESEVKVVTELYNVLVKRMGKDAAMKEMARLHMDEGLLYGFDKVFGVGTHADIYKFMDNGQYNQAVKYIKALQ
jgi:hypothetical protein